MKKFKIIIKTKSKNYPIIIGENILGKTGNLINNQIPSCKKIALIIDSKVPKKILVQVKNSIKNFDNLYIKLNTSEKIKNFKIVSELINKLLKKNFHRNDCLIALGGGVLGDIAGLTASLVKRGIKFINIPTTLLAQVDASIGGKTAINSSQGKNLIGTFYQPEFVLVDISMLNSLPRREIICGYGEILKHSLILDRKFFLWLSLNAKKIINNKDKNLLKIAVIRSCKIKSKIVNKDEREKNLRMILNFGHTFAHGFEGAKNFSKKLSHGEAVLLGMMMASQLSYQKKLLSLKDLMLIKKHYLSLNLPMKIKKFFKKKEINKIIYFMKKDKKNLNEKINLILIKKIGKTTQPNSFAVNSSEIKKFLTVQYI